MKNLIATLVLLPSLLMAQQNQPARSVIVRTGHATRQTIAQSIKKTGNLVSPAIVDISAKISGRLESLALEDGTIVTEGTTVKRGQRIGTIEARDYMAQLDVAHANLQSANATLVDKKRELERLNLLYEQGVSTERDRDLAVADYERSNAAVAQAQAQLDIAKINLDETRIYAPMDGVVSARIIEPGTLLTTGTRILTITQTDVLRFQLNVPTTLFAQLSLETGIAMEVDAYPGEVINATITRIFPVAEAGTRTIRVETQIGNSKGRYLPGMYAVGTLALNQRDHALVLPFETVIRNIDRNFVYVVEDGIAKVRDVTVGIRADAMVEILDGITETDIIVFVGQHRLADNTPVTIDAK